jgi:nitroreductase
MSQLEMTTDDLLSTTRAVRKRLDFERPVPNEVVMECLELALQAPSGSNAQGWHFMFVTDEDKRAQIAEIYREAFRSPRFIAKRFPATPTLQCPRQPCTLMIRA